MQPVPEMLKWGRESQKIAPAGVGSISTVLEKRPFLEHESMLRKRYPKRCAPEHDTACHRER